MDHVSQMILNYIGVDMPRRPGLDKCVNKTLCSPNGH